MHKTDGMTENIIYNDEQGGFLDEGGNEIDLMIGHQGKKDIRPLSEIMVKQCLS